MVTILVITDKAEVNAQFDQSIAAGRIKAVFSKNVREAYTRVRFQDFEIVFFFGSDENSSYINFIRDWRNNDLNRKKTPPLFVAACNKDRASEQKELELMGIKMVTVTNSLPDDLLSLIHSQAKTESTGIDVKMINPFLQASIDTLFLNTKEKPQPQKPHIKPQSVTLGDVNDHRKARNNDHAPKYDRNLSPVIY